MLIPGLIIAALAIIPAISWFRKYFQRIFWISFVLYFNPAGIFSSLSEGNLISKLKYFDLLFLSMMFAWYLSGYWRNRIVENNRSFRFFLITLTLYVVYMFAVYGFIVPSVYDYQDVGMFLQKHRQYLFSIPIFISVYQFACYQLNAFIKPLLFISAISMGTYFVSLIFGLDIIPVMTWSRFGENDRIAPLSYGLAKWFIAMGFFAIFTGMNLKNKNIFYSMINLFLMVLAITLTLTRREYVEIFFVIVFSAILSNNIRPGFVMKGMKNIILAFFIFAGTIFLLFPQYLSFSSQLASQLTGMVMEDNPGPDSDYRVTGKGDLIIAKDLIAEHPLFGIGYYPAQWDKIVEMKKSGILLGLALDASSEVPIYGAFMRMGFIGLILPSIIHISLLLLSIKSIKSIKGYIPYFNERPMEFLLYLNFIYMFISLFTIDLFALFLEYYSPLPYTFFSAAIALLLAIRTRLEVSTKSPSQKQMNEEGVQQLSLPQSLQSI